MKREKKAKQKGKIKSIYTSIHYRMFSICISVAVFILVVTAAIAVELYDNQQNYIAMYENQQRIFVEQLQSTLFHLYEDGATDEEVISYLSEDVEASGSRFFVLTKKETVLFAKNDITTKCLGSLSDKTEFYKSIDGDDVSIERAPFNVGDNNYEITIVSDLYTIRTDGELMKHQYYILVAIAIMSLVLISLLLTLVGSWNKTQRNLEGTEKELSIRNEKMEIISQETGTLTSDKTDMLTQGEEIGIIQSEKTEFYNIYTLRMLLQKSEDAQLKPLQMFFVKVVMEDRYFSKEEIFGAMRMVQKTLKETEIMGEVRKGFFLILAYKTTVEEAKERQKELFGACKKVEHEKGIRLNVELIEEDESSAIERFEANRD